MNRQFILSTLAAGLFLISCNNSDNSIKSKELELKQKELELKEKELQLKVDSINQATTAKPKIVEKKQSENYNQELLLGGCWFIPHSATMNIKFYRDFTFKFNDFDMKSMKKLFLSGTYTLDGHDLWLNYNDRPKQNFYFYKAELPDKNYYIKGYPIKTSSYYFVHGECE